MAAQSIERTGIRTFRIGFALVALAMLALPFIAMQFSTNDVDWAPGDFLVAAAMLFALGAGIEVIVRLVSHRWLRATLIALGLASFLFVWAMLATG